MNHIHNLTFFQLLHKKIQTGEINFNTLTQNIQNALSPYNEYKKIIKDKSLYSFLCTKFSKSYMYFTFIAYLSYD